MNATTPMMPHNTEGTHFSIWCIMASPLILNHNIFPGKGAVDAQITKIITNKEVISINQDALGKSVVLAACVAPSRQNELYAICARQGLQCLDAIYNVNR
jgi:hypothetical protein